MKTLTISITKNTVLTDVKDNAWFTGRSRKNGTNDEAIAAMQAGEDESDVLFRFLEAANADVRVPMSHALARSESDTLTGETDTLIADTLTYALTLNDNWDSSQQPALQQNIHAYLQNKVLGDWFTIANPSEAANYLAKAEDCLNNIRKALSSRTRPVRLG